MAKTYAANFVKMKDIYIVGVVAMIQKIKTNAGRLFLSVVAVACFVFISNGAVQAAPVAGCNPKVLDAMQKKAQAQVGLDIANTEQIINKPDSVLAVTCFNKAAGTSAAKGGAIFSGDFTSGLTPIITDALNAFFKQFGDSEGQDSGVVDYAATALTNAADCDGVSKLWDQIKQEGVKSGVPWATFADLLNGTLPAGAGPTFAKNWSTETSDNVFSDLKAAFTALPVPAIPSFAGVKTGCDALIAAGVLASCP